MARLELTNAQLKTVSIDINKQADASPAFRTLLSEKIKRFYQQNKFLLKIIDEREAGFVRKYAKHDEFGVPITEEKEDGNHYTFDNEEIKEKYLAELREFMERTVTVEL